MWLIGAEVEQETSAPPPKKNPGPAPDNGTLLSTGSCVKPLILKGSNFQAIECHFPCACHKLQTIRRTLNILNHHVLIITITFIISIIIIIIIIAITRPVTLTSTPHAVSYISTGMNTSKYFCIKV